MKRRFRVTVNGKTFEVEAESLDEVGSSAPVPIIPTPAPVPASVPTASAAPTAAAAPAPAPKPAAGGAGAVLSPLAGKVVSIDTPVGTSVKTGDKVITLEAMKMNTVVSAHADGTITGVHVAPGDAVEEGQPLLTIG